MKIFLFKHKTRLTEADARRYVDDVLCGPDRLFKGPYTLSRFASGTAPGVYRLDFAAVPSMVIRFHRLDHPEDRERFFRYHETLTSHGLPIPALLHIDRSAATRRAYGAEVTLEELIVGSHFEGQLKGDLAITGQLGRLLARLHAITKEAHGLPWRPIVVKTYFQHLMAEIEQFYAKLLKKSDLITRREVKGHLQWFGQWENPLNSIQRFNLLHGDFQPRNVIIRPDHRISMIDFIEMRFGGFELDLAFSDLSMAWDSAEARGTFLEEYFQAMGEEARERYQRHALFFDAYAHLAKAYAKAARAYKVGLGRKREKKPYAENAAGLLGQLREIIS